MIKENKMTAKIARDKIEDAVLRASSKLKEAGLTTRPRSFYTDKNLTEEQEFSPKTILVFGDLAFGYGDMEEDDYCNYSICCEIKTGLVDDKELEDGIAAFEDEIESVLTKLAKATNPSAVLEEISRLQSEEAEEAAREFSKEMRKVKLKLYIAVAAIIVIIASVLIVGPMLK